jgi:hypothetical protein
MSLLVPVIGWVAAAGCAVVLVRHHVGYLRRTRPYSFGAFMETSGWIILLLVGLGAVVGGLAEMGTRVVEIAAMVVALFFIGIGSSLR